MIEARSRGLLRGVVLLAEAEDTYNSVRKLFVQAMAHPATTRKEMDKLIHLLNVCYRRYERRSKAQRLAWRIFSQDNVSDQGDNARREGRWRTQVSQVR
jgi:hypothetical protein